MADRWPDTHHSAKACGKLMSLPCKAGPLAVKVGLRYMRGAGGTEPRAYHPSPMAEAPF